jgi:hypothetical protein
VRACIIKYYARGVVTVMVIMMVHRCTIMITITTIISSSTPHQQLISSV